MNAPLFVDPLATDLPAKGFLRRFSHRKSALIGVAIFGVILMGALIAPALWSSPFDMIADPLIPPFQDLAHPLGTDMLGRDLLAGLVWSARVSLTIGMVASLTSVAFGTAVGLVSGWYGGWVDALLMRIGEYFQIIPPFALAVVIAALLRASTESTIIAISVASWPAIARLVRGECLSLRDREFVLAATASGQHPLSIIWHEVLPNAMSPVIVSGSLMVASAILTESALSFLGLGSAEAMSWGFMIGAARNMIREAWWMSIWPGIAIVLTVLSIQLIGEGLREALSVHRRHVNVVGDER